MNEKNMKTFEQLLQKLEPGRRKLVDDMLATQVGIEYVTAPASSRVDFHSCYPGGLLQHSLNVVRNLIKISTALCPDQFSKETLIFVGLFHDLGKVGDGERPYYVQTDQDWKRRRGELYDINKECVYMPTSERGLYLLQKHKIELTSDEYLAIRLNDGQYAEENKPYRMKEPSLAILTSMADLWAAREEKITDSTIS